MPVIAKKCSCMILLLATSLLLAAEAKEEEKPDPWAPLRLLEGKWEGAIDGRLGQGRGQRSYAFVLEDRFVLMRHASVRLPQTKSPRGDHHREIGLFSFDRERDKLILREFMVEGYVNRYTCEGSPKKLVCVTENVENGTGMKARLTLEIQDHYRFEEKFELAGPEQPLQLYFTNRWTRTPALGDAPR